MTPVSTVSTVSRVCRESVEGVEPGLKGRRAGVFFTPEEAALERAKSVAKKRKT